MMNDDVRGYGRCCRVRGEMVCTCKKMESVRVKVCVRAKSGDILYHFPSNFHRLSHEDSA